MGRIVTYTPVEHREGIWLKRDDLYEYAGVRGGKVRTCVALATAPGVVGLVTAGARSSPQALIVARVAASLGIPARIHTPSGALGAEVLAAQAAGAEIVQHSPGYNSVIVARAREDAAVRGWCNIPFGMECDEAVRQTAGQVGNLPPDANRIVIPVGSGMSLAGLLTGMIAAGDHRRVIGVVVGADPRKRLDRYGPLMWQYRVDLVLAQEPYAKHVPGVRIGGVLLDEVYEAKCLPFLLLGDCLWVVGIGATRADAPS